MTRSCTLTRRLRTLRPNRGAMKRAHSEVDAGEEAKEDVVRHQTRHANRLLFDTRFSQPPPPPPRDDDEPPPPPPRDAGAGGAAAATVDDADAAPRAAGAGAGGASIKCPYLDTINRHMLDFGAHSLWSELCPAARTCAV